jgi:hypothetical protein
LVTQGGLGVLGTKDVNVIYGGAPVDYGTFSGFRLGLGGWIDADQLWGLEASGFFLCQDTRSFTAQSNALGQPTLGQPVIAPGLGEEAYLTSLVGLYYGTIRSELTFRFYGWEINGMRNLLRQDGLQVDALVGYRNLRLSEQLLLRSNVRTLVPGVLTFLGNPIPANAQLLTGDSFGASTDVYVPQIGGHVRYTSDRLSADLTAKVGLGCATEKVSIYGTTWFNPPFPAVRSQLAAGGILAQTTNMPGGTATGRFVVVPEVAGRVSYEVLDGLFLSVGYSFLYLSEVVRPGNQIDRVVNPNNVPTDQDFGKFVGPARPAFEMRHSSFWAHGVNLGAEFRF